MVDSTSPILFLDFDGVLGTFPDMVGVSYDDVGVVSALVARAGIRLVQAGRIPGVIDLRWLSTWQPYVHVLDGLLGWDPDIVHNTRCHDPPTGRRALGRQDAHGRQRSDTPDARRGRGRHPESNRVDRR